MKLRKVRDICAAQTRTLWRAGEIDKNTGPCEYKISGVSKVMYSGKNDGDLVAYKNGVEVSRKKF